MQRFNNFTKKSGKVASAILSAAMVTSMLAGTNVVYAATEATEATTDVELTGTEEEKALKAVDELKTAYKNLPVTTKTTTENDLSKKDFTEPAKKVTENKDYGVTTAGALSYLVTKNPTATKAGEAELTVQVEANGVTTSGAISDSIKYTLPSGKDRAATVKTALEEYIDKEVSVTKLNEANAKTEIKNTVGDFFSQKNDGDGSLDLYNDVNNINYNLTTTAPEADKRGSVEGTVSFSVVDKDGKTIGNAVLNVNKEILTDKEVVDTAKEDLDKYIDEVKYFTSATVESDYDKIITKYKNEKLNSTVDLNGDMNITKSAGKTITGKALANATLIVRNLDSDPVAKAEITNKEIAIPSDNAKVESVLNDLVKYAKEVSVDADTKAVDFNEEFAKAINNDNNDINMNAKDSITIADGATKIDNLSDVYGAGVEATVDFTVAASAKDDKPVATITVTVNETTKKAIVDTFGVKAEESKGSFEEKDGKKYYYDANGNTLKNTYLQGTDSPDGYTYYIQADGSVMQDRLTYTPDGKYIIYFDEDGHEVFDAFVNVKKDMQGNDVDYIAYFDTFGHAYTNITTYGNGEGTYSKDSLFYINDYGVLQTNGWFKNAEGNIGYAAENGALTTSQWGVDQFGRKVYFQANGFLAKGLITDGVKYYQLDENDGHLVGEF